MTDNLNKAVPEQKGTAIGLIGTGAMGTALGIALRNSGYNVYAWNRTKTKAAAVIAAGAEVSDEVEQVINRCEIIIICINDYEATSRLLNHENLDLAGKTFIQLSTGTPLDATTAAKWMNEKRAVYLDGAILATPSQMGRPDTPIFVAGAEKDYKNCEAVLRSLGGNIIYTGSEIRHASAWDLAILSGIFGFMTGFLHGAKTLQHEKIAVADYGNMLSAIAPVIGEMVKDTADDIEQERYTDPESSIDICVQSFELMLRQAKEGGLNSETPAFLHHMFNKARAAGDGDKRISAVFKSLR